MKAPRCGSGFTLVELLFATTASVLFVGGVFSLFVSFSRLYHAGTTQMAIQSRARNGIDRIAAGVSAAETVSVQSGGDRLDVTIPITNLSADVSSSASAIPVVWTGLLLRAGVIYIGNEAIAYSDKNATSLLSCSRGQLSTSAASHQTGDIVYARVTYYLSGASIYLNANGAPSAASDEAIIWAAEKTAGTNLFRLVPRSGAYRYDRVLLAFKCYDDRNNNNRRELSEPGLDFGIEIFPRNK